MTKMPREKERDQLNQLAEVVAALPQEHGVLLSDQIKKCVDDFKLIWPFHEDQLKPASYRLTVGDRYALGGDNFTLREDGDIKVEPFQVVVIQTLERLNLPRNMIARWNIKVKLAYDGLIWAGGPQVDPGWQGHLFCPIYNLSDRTVTLHYGDQIAVIDFTKTTAFDENASLKFPRPPDAVVLEDYKTDWRSALHAYASVTIKGMEEKIKNAEAALSLFVGITFAVMGVLVAALAVPQQKPLPSSLPTLLGLSALILSVVTLLRGTAVPSAALKTWLRAVLLVFVSAVCGAVCWWLVQEYCWPVR